MSARNTLILLTEDYPFGISERSFLKEEINHLSSAFESVYIFPIRAGNEVLFDLPKNVYTSSKLAEALLHVNRKAKFGGITSSDFIGEAIRLFFKPKKVKLALAKSIAAEVIKDFLRENIKRQSSDTVFYSYWYNESALAISSLQQKDPSLRTVSRCHNFDLYGNEENAYYVPYQKIILQRLTKVFPVSQDGADFLNDKFQSTVEPRYLGVLDPNFTNYGSNDQVIRLLSCAYMVYRKRLDIIARGLVCFCNSNKDQKILWTHIGDGPEFESVNNLLKDKPENLDVEFKGSLSNEAVLEFYKSNPVDLFINTSDKEGTPVSIMEAISYGVPIMVSGFGGNKEVAEKGAGLLLPVNSGPEDFSIVLSQFISSDRQKLGKLSKRVWDLGYNSERNYIRFSKELSEL